MPTINDYKKRALNNQGYSGDINTAEYKWLRAQVAPYKGAIPDMWRKYLYNLGYTTGALPNNFYKWLGSLGYTGTINQRWYNYWKQGVEMSLSRLTGYGDSTCKGDGANTSGGKFLTMLAGDVGLTLFNDGQSGQSIADCATRVAADTSAHKRSLVIIVDHANTGETRAAYAASLASIIASIGHSFFLIWPQMGVTDGSDDATMLQLRADINTDIIANWPNNTFDATEQAALIAALNDSTTRADGIHRNDKGQAIECFYSSAFLQRKGWRATTAEATALIARMSGTPTAKRQSYINALIERQKGAGLWSNYDCFHVQAAHDDQAHTLNWISSSFPLTKTGTVTFVADKGDTGNGSTGRMLTGFNPTTATSPKFVQNNARFTVYPVTDVAENAADGGQVTGGSGCTRINSRNADNSISRQINQASTTFTGGGGANKTLFGVTRTSSAGMVQQIGSVIGTETSDASVAPANQEFAYNGGAGGFGTKQIAMGSIGSGVAAALQQADYYSRTAYLKAVGAIA